METYLSGLGLGAGLIIAIGAQNAFVLRQGIRREHVGITVVICMLGDILLVSLGAAGLGVVVEHLPWLIPTMRILGAAYLLLFAYRSFQSARRAGGGLEAAGSRPAAGWWAVAASAAAITFLNPHVYLDTVIFLGSMAQQFPSPWIFAAGAITASTVWFSALGFGARALAKPLANPRAWRIIDYTVAVMMFVLALMLLAPVVI